MTLSRLHTPQAEKLKKKMKWRIKRGKPEAPYLCVLISVIRYAGEMIKK